MALAGGTLIPILVSLGSRLFPPQGPAAAVTKHIKTMDILAIATGLTLWTAILTVTIGCFVVIVMKGPAYVADRYDLIDADKPSPGPKTRSP